MKKIDVALQHLENGLRLFVGRQFVSALTLAAAAQEILGSQINRTPQTPPQRSSLDREANRIANDDKLFDPTKTRTAANVKKELSRSKNSAKHFNDLKYDPEFSFDAEVEACDWLIRAIEDYRVVFPEQVDKFGEQLDELLVAQISSTASILSAELARGRLVEYTDWLRSRPDLVVDEVELERVSAWAQRPQSGSE